MNWADTALIASLLAAGCVAFDICRRDQAQRRADAQRAQSIGLESELAKSVGSTLEEHGLALKSLRLKIESLSANIRR